MQTIEQLHPGRELDRHVAERVMGWRWMNAPEGIPICYLVEPNKVQKGLDAGYTMGRTKYEDTHLVPAYSTSIEAVWPVLEQFIAKGAWAGVGGNPDEGWCAFIEFKGLELLASEATAPTAPLAICRAALAAIGEVA